MRDMDVTDGGSRELEDLVATLQRQRAVLRRKAVGLTDDQLRRAHPPSTLSLAALLSHAALNEDWWFTVRLAGGDEPAPWTEADWEADEDWEMSLGQRLPGDELRRLYDDAVGRSDAVIRALGGDLDAPEAWEPAEEPRSRRWILLHMIEETARHAGHADLIREAIDGETGE